MPTLKVRLLRRESHRYTNGLTRLGENASGGRFEFICRGAIQVAQRAFDDALIRRVRQRGNR
jgi:hypothetical protein